MSTIEQIEERIKAIAPATPEMIAARERVAAESAESARRIKVATMRAGWNAPKRAMALECHDLTGEWGKRLGALTARLGTGFLVGLIGGRGPGKTQMGYELMKATTENLKRAYYATATEFFMAIKATYKREAEETEEDIVRQYRKVDLLVLDEVSKRGETDWEDRLLFELLDSRYRDMSDTLLISNEEKAAFESSIGPSVSARMRETGGIIQCNWPSFRK